MNNKTGDVSTRLTPDDLDKRSMDARVAVMEEALKAEKVHYKSQCNLEKFKTFLEHRFMIWDELKDKTFYAKRMHAKTQEVLTGISGQTQA